MPPPPGPNRESASCRDVSCAPGKGTCDVLRVSGAHPRGSSVTPPSSPSVWEAGLTLGSREGKGQASTCPPGARPVLPRERLPRAAVVAGRGRAAGRGDKAVRRGLAHGDGLTLRSPRPLPSPRPPPPVGSPTSSQVCTRQPCPRPNVFGASSPVPPVPTWPRDPGGLTSPWPPSARCAHLWPWWPLASSSPRSHG